MALQAPAILLATGDPSEPEALGYYLWNGYSASNGYTSLFYRLLDERWYIRSGESEADGWGGPFEYGTVNSPLGDQSSYDYGPLAPFTGTITLTIYSYPGTEYDTTVAGDSWDAVRISEPQDVDDGTLSSDSLVGIRLFGGITEDAATSGDLLEVLYTISGICLEESLNNDTLEKALELHPNIDETNLTSDQNVGTRVYYSDAAEDSVSGESHNGHITLRESVENGHVASDQVTQGKDRLASLRYRAKSGDKNRRYKTMSDELAEGIVSTDLESGCHFESLTILDGSLSSNTEQATSTLRKRVTDRAIAGNAHTRAVTLIASPFADMAKSGDSFRKHQTLQQTTANGLLSSDGKVYQATYASAISEEFIASDVTGLLLPTLYVACVEGIKSSDANAPIRTHRRRVIVEGTRTSDTFRTVLSLAYETVDEIAAGSSIAGKYTFYPVQSETIVSSSTTGTATRLRAVTSDGADAMDQWVHIIELHPSVADGAKPGDAASRISTLYKTVTDGAKSTDSSSRKGEEQAASSEGATSSDTPRTYQTLYQGSTEGAESGDAENSARLFGRSTTDRADAGDLRTFLYTFRTRLYNKVIATDRSRQLMTIQRGTGDEVVSSDLESSIRLFPVEWADTLVASDVEMDTLDLLKYTVDASLAADTLVRLTQEKQSPYDAAASSDLIAASKTTTGPVENTANASDAETALVTLRPTRAEGATTVHETTGAVSANTPKLEGGIASSSFEPEVTYLYKKIEIRSAVLKAASASASRLKKPQITNTILNPNVEEDEL